MSGRNKNWRGFYIAHDRLTADPVGPSLTRQEFAAECDINNLMKRYANAGVISHVNNTQPRYLDLSETPDLMTALNMMHNAQEAFMRLPATVRREFDNDPVAFVEFASREDSLPRLREWGLAAPEAAPEPPIRVEVTNASPPPAGGS